MDAWTLLTDLVFLIGIAVVLGAVFERLRQTAILGYLLSGVLVGPHVLHLVPSRAEVEVLAELGVALLLFSIGLEFSWSRLRRLGRVALVGGGLQVGITAVIAALLAGRFGLNVQQSVTLGAVVALSSTACVLPLLGERSELDSAHGRATLGVLLFQDVTVVPLVLMVESFGMSGTTGEVLLDVLRDVGIGLAVALVFGFVLRRVVPKLLSSGAFRNRELSMMLALVVGLGSAIGVHAMGLSPALGAFVAGVLLGESPFATQIRADVAPLRVLLMTLFFSSVGMFADPAWIVAQLPLVLGLVLVIVVGKALLVWGVLRLCGVFSVEALAAGLCLAQVGEFSFVVAQAARGPVLDESLFSLVVSIAIVTLFLTPLLVRRGPALGRKLLGASAANVAATDATLRDHVVLVGYGPAGQAVAAAVQAAGVPTVVLDLDARSMVIARASGIDARVGDARQAVVLEHLELGSAAALVVTIPDPAAAQQIVRLARGLAPDLEILARCRYHRFAPDLLRAGASEIIDEEVEVGAAITTRLEPLLVADWRARAPESVP